MPLTSGCKHPKANPATLQDQLLKSMSCKIDRACCHSHPRACASIASAIPLRVQVPNYHILSKIVAHLTTIPKPQYLIVGSFEPLGFNTVLQRQTFHCPLPCFLLLQNTSHYLNPEEPTFLGFLIMISLYKSLNR